MSNLAHTEDANDLAVQHVSLVRHLVRETMARVPSHVDRDDLMAAGLVALVTASRSFDAGRGVPFAPYAAMRVRGAILDELRSLDWASRQVRRRARETGAARAELAGTLGATPTNRAVAESLGVSVAEIERNDGDVQRAQVLSVEALRELAPDAVPRSAAPSPDEQAEHRERLTYLVEAVAELPDRLRVVISEYFLHERPMAQIAAELGVTESRVSQMRAEALVLLRDALNHELEPTMLVAHTRPGGAAARRRDAYFAAVAHRHATHRRPA
jgi:RNA polymerase sigma factor FliA